MVPDEGIVGAKPLDAQEAHRILAAEAKKRESACGEEIAAVLARHSCVLVAVPGYVPSAQGWILQVALEVRARPGPNGAG